MGVTAYRVSGHRFCSNAECPKSFPNHKHGTIGAHQDGWFLQRNGDAWCPDHIPDWVAEWRAKKNKKGS
ncbi:hypothetical protein SEA_OLYMPICHELADO_65 [Streptomyces phage OlympicHelado]|uniref:Uncharacterized protein n=1 Tax=Streptomyces phage OlympicHelado TaxID=1897524 RepID=A0A1I9SDK3_9CAUD|nr:hypothetical protein SEA_OLYMPICHELADO_65 [Streptomyces phage OlympicHelado]